MSSKAVDKVIWPKQIIFADEGIYIYIFIYLYMAENNSFGLKIAFDNALMTEIALNSY